MLQSIRAKLGTFCPDSLGENNRAWSIAIGAGLGAPLGMIAFDNVGVGIAFGVALGTSGIFMWWRR
ncbi:MAG: hypothetical protein U5Q44_01155 [Dehalococcoidia bacterium]|nr:hypothetical protein [Dehalococcoidia bacterium]